MDKNDPRRRFARRAVRRSLEKEALEEAIARERKHAADLVRERLRPFTDEELAEMDREREELPDG